jgi:hypothetical protein
LRKTINYKIPSKFYNEKHNSIVKMVVKIHIKKIFFLLLVSITLPNM